MNAKITENQISEMIQKNGKQIRENKGKHEEIQTKTKQRQTNEHMNETQFNQESKDTSMSQISAGELGCIYETETEVSMFNENTVLKPHAYQLLFAQIAEKHLNSLHINADDTMSHGVAWALVSMTIDICKQIHGCEKLYAQTWHSQHKGPYWRRELVFKNKAGETVFQGSTFSVLLNIEKRTVCRTRETPFFALPPTEIFMCESAPTFKKKLEYVPYEQRKAQNSYIDMLGHVNNCRYAEFAYDAFTDEERENLTQFKRMEIYFASELRRGDLFTIGKAYEDDKMYIRGYNDTKGDTSFYIVFTK